ncbi:MULTISPECIES: hypothetical protein [Streptomyces]|uniref:hypothetical protein n=1 Tax=Streptomyces TaxID=1883 RepID=UPI000F55407D|nr:MULTISPECIES: hypothetical protein [Streptomyces]MBZ6107745.1 hypothetical protein [Streptomyces olivaceus]
MATASVRRQACFSLMVRGEEVGAALAWEIGEGGAGDALRDACRRSIPTEEGAQPASYVGGAVPVPYGRRLYLGHVTEQRPAIGSVVIADLPRGELSHDYEPAASEAWFTVVVFP